MWRRARRSSPLRPNSRAMSALADSPCSRRKASRVSLSGKPLGRLSLGGLPLATQILRGREGEGLPFALGGLKLVFGEAPVGHLVPPGLQEGFAVILVVQIVGVLPKIADDQRRATVLEHGVAVVSRDNL